MRDARWSVMCMVLFVAAVAACGGPSATPSPHPTGLPAASVSGASERSERPEGSESPEASEVPESSEAPEGSDADAESGPPDGSTGPLPSLTLFDPGRTLDPATIRWPADIIDAAIALAVLDNGIKEAGTDLSTAAQERDMQLFLGAATGLATIVEEAQPSAQKLVGYGATKAVGESYLPVLSELDAAASAMAAGLRAGDAEQVQAASAQLGTALEAYRGVRAAMVEIVDQAILMRRGALE